MTDSVTINPPAVYGAICDVMAEMAKQGIAKASRNGQQGYNFRGIDDVYNALCSVLAKNRICMLPFAQTMQREERTTKNGGALNYTILTVDFTIACAVDGSTTIVRTVGEAMDSADKSANKAQSAALKYAAMQVFMIPTEGDNDADATMHDLAPRVPDIPVDHSRHLSGQSESAPTEALEPKEGWGDWTRALIAKVTTASTGKQLDEIKTDEKRRINAVRKHDATMFAEIGKAFDAARKIVLDNDVPF